MEWPSLAAAIGGPAVGIAAIIGARLEGRDNRGQAVALSQAEREHERDEARAARHFEMRRSAYVELLQHALMSLDAIQATEPVVRLRGEPASG